jgi:hypothetical protein
VILAVEPLVFELAGAVLALFTWTAAVVSWRCRYPAAEPVHRGGGVPSRSAIYADIDDVMDALDDPARDRRWDLAKRFAIARMACENRTATVAALERQYQNELRAVSDAPTTGNCSVPSIR